MWFWSHSVSYLNWSIIAATLRTWQTMVHAPAFGYLSSLQESDCFLLLDASWKGAHLGEGLSKRKKNLPSFSPASVSHRSDLMHRTSPAPSTLHMHIMRSNAVVCVMLIQSSDVTHSTCVICQGSQPNNEVGSSRSPLVLHQLLHLGEVRRVVDVALVGLDGRRVLISVSGAQINHFPHHCVVATCTNMPGVCNHPCVVAFTSDDRGSE